MVAGKEAEARREIQDMSRRKRQSSHPWQPSLFRKDPRAISLTGQQAINRPIFRENTLPLPLPAPPPLGTGRIAGTLQRPATAPLPIRGNSPRNTLRTRDFRRFDSFQIPAVRPHLPCPPRQRSIATNTSTTGQLLHPQRSPSRYPNCCPGTMPNR